MYTVWASTRGPFTNAALHATSLAVLMCFPAVPAPPPKNSEGQNSGACQGDISPSAICAHLNHPIEELWIAPVVSEPQQPEHILDARQKEPRHDSAQEGHFFYAHPIRKAAWHPNSNQYSHAQREQSQGRHHQGNPLGIRRPESMTGNQQPNAKAERKHQLATGTREAHWHCPGLRRSFGLMGQG